MRMLGRIFLLLLVLCLGAASWQWWGYSHRQLVAPNAEVVFDVPRGHAGARLAEVLQQAGVDVPSWKMALALRLRGDAARIKAGNYLITGPATLQGLLDELVSGQQEKGKLITLVEGWNMRDLRAALKKAPDLNDTLSGLSDAALMEKLGMPGVNPEGRFAPDTYAYRPGSDDVELLRRALVLQQRRLDAAWENRATDSPLKTPAELLTLASVVEKETGHALDREMVASVFTNRLRKGMPLQSDPTTIYGLGERFAGNLRKKDLRLQLGQPGRVHVRAPALIGKGRIGEPVTDHPLAGGKRRSNQRVQMVAAGRKGQQRLGLRLHLLGQQQLAQPLGQRAATRFAAEHHGLALCTQPIHTGPHVRALARAVDALESNETALHEILRGHGRAPGLWPDSWFLAPEAAFLGSDRFSSAAAVPFSGFPPARRWKRSTARLWLARSAENSERPSPRATKYSLSDCAGRAVACSA